MAYALAQSHVRDLCHRRHAVEHHALVAPVELVAPVRSNGERDIGFRRLLGSSPLSGATVAAHRVVAARMAFQPKRLVDPPEREPLAGALGHVLCQHLVETHRERPGLR